ncbi:MAG TPA: 5-dehydro-4-deoxy-D-glucuronate isomerase, partial [Flavisolibacter sp.]|nr:5-dehydro-4-deoxy-D-glucuronate isomerase [Flavisolibacter sp.]
YSHHDRMITGAAVPVGSELKLTTYEELKSEFFLERREMGIINIGGDGSVKADGQEYNLSKLDCLYLGRGTKEVSFSSADAKNPARYFILSAPAHHTFINTLMKSSEATPAALGSSETANERTIYKYIHDDGIKSCQLVMGLTILKPGSVWNTMPAHTHNRRMEVYLYFDVKEGQRVFHLMGEPQETRHLVIGNEEAVISAPWSIHSGCGTTNYSFIWGMAGENKAFADMDGVAIGDLR